MKKPISKKFDIIEPVFCSCVTIIVGWKWDKLKNYLNKHQHLNEKPIDDFHEFSSGVQFQIKTKSGRIAWVIYLNQFVYMAKDLGILVHEVGHLVFRILETKQVPIRGENDEVFCYLQEYYVREIIKKI